MAIIQISQDRVTEFISKYNSALGAGATADQALQVAIQQLVNDLGSDPVTVQQSLIAQGVTQAGSVDVT